jgi:hypothetical protein
MPDLPDNLGERRYIVDILPVVNERGFLTLHRMMQRPVVLLFLHVRLESWQCPIPTNYMYRFVLTNNTFVLLPGWIITIALQSFPIS